MAANWQDEKIKTLVDLTDDGLIARQIGDVMGCGRSAISEQWNRWKIRHGGELVAKLATKFPHASEAEIIEATARERAPSLLANAKIRRENDDYRTELVAEMRRYLAEEFA